MKKNNIVKLSLVTILSLQSSVLANTNENTNTLNSVDVVASDSYNVKSTNTSTGLNLSLKDTPQVISVLTTQELEDKGLESLDDLFNHITGVTINRFDERVDPKARGFSLDYYKIDGVPYATSFSSRTLDLSLYERVEVVKGANGLTTGAGGPGISINLIRKRANSKEQIGKLGVKIDSEGSYILNADLSSGLNEDGSVRGRIVAKHEDSNFYLDDYETKKNILMGIIDIDFSDSSRLSTGLSYEKVEKENVRYGGIPSIYSDGSSTNYDVSTNLTDDWTYTDTETLSLFTKFDHYFSNDFLLTASYNFEKTKRENAWLYFWGYEDSGFIPLGTAGEHESRRHEVDLKLNIPYEFNNLTSEVLIGYTYNIDKETKRKTSGRFYPTILGGSFPNYDVSEPDLSSFTNRDLSKTKQSSFYLANNLNITERLKIILGGRFTDYYFSSEDDSIDVQDFNEFTPYAGLVFDFTKNTSGYFSYTSIFNPQFLKDSNENYLDPVVGNSYEAGIKGEYFDQALIATLGFFHTKQDNLGEEDGMSSTGETIYKSADGVVSKGIELSLSGMIGNNTTLSFDLTKFKAKDQNGDKFNTIASRTTASLFAKYDYNDFTFGGGVDYNSKTYLVNTTNTITQDAYYLVNLMGIYRINKNLSTQVNISNLFNEKYYEGMMSDNYILYGAPRTITAQLTYSF